MTEANMTPSKAREIIIKGATFRLEKDKPYTLLELIDESIRKNNEVYFAKGFLVGDAYRKKKAEVLVGALDLIGLDLQALTKINRKDFLKIVNDAFTEYAEENND